MGINPCPLGSPNGPNGEQQLGIKPGSPNGGQQMGINPCPPVYLMDLMANNNWALTQVHRMEGINGHQPMSTELSQLGLDGERQMGINPCSPDGGQQMGINRCPYSSPTTPNEEWQMGINPCSPDGEEQMGINPCPPNSSMGSVQPQNGRQRMG